MHRDKLRAAYGDLAMQSAPADPANPSFASLLSAYQEVHEGRLGRDALQTYHDHLQAEVARSRADLAATGDEHTIRMSGSTLDLSELALNAIPAYLADPSDERMADCVQRLLIAHNAMQQLHHYIDLQKPAG